MSDFSQRLTRLREEKGWSKRELEKIAKIPNGIVSRLESGIRDYPSVPVAKKLAEVLGVTLDYLCGMYEGKPARPTVVDQCEAEPTTAVLCAQCAGTIA